LIITVRCYGELFLHGDTEDSEGHQSRYEINCRPNAHMVFFIAIARLFLEQASFTAAFGCLCIYPDASGCTPMKQF